MPFLQVFGWGFFNDSDTSWPNELRYGQLTVLSHKDCYMRDQQFFGKRLRPGYNFCAGGYKSILTFFSSTYFFHA
jgi:hypothetical protein